MKTLFKYRCSCGNTDFFKIDQSLARCVVCGHDFLMSPSGVINFYRSTTSQNLYFDEIYKSGYANVVEKQEDKKKKGGGDEYKYSSERTDVYLKLAGIDITCPVEKISILDVACGSGWVTAGLMQKKNLNNCKFHAFDISPEGPNMLARFASNLKTSNCLEMSVQDAEAMKFSDDTFDVIIGSSVLHHFDNYESFLNDCRRILRPGGAAIFGEPFALGYGMAAAVLLTAQKKLKTNYKEIETNYNDIAFRNVNPRALFNGLVDKHLFYSQTINSLAQDLGFSSVSFNNPNTSEYIRNSLMNELLRERGIDDNLLAEYANNIWGTFFDVFGNNNLEYSLCPFMNIVFRK